MIKTYHPLNQTHHVVLVGLILNTLAPLALKLSYSKN
jgi:hypothetical protein